MFFCLTCYILQIGAGARVNDGNVELKRLVLASRGVVEECPRLRCCVHSQRVQYAVLSASSLLEGRRIFSNKLHFAFAKGTSHCLVEHLVVGESSILYCAGYSVETSGFLSVTVAMTYPTTLKPTIALVIAVLSKFWRSCRSFFPRGAWRARESFDSTRGTTPTHTSPTSRLVWLNS